ncbi:MAG: tail fiber domain-containing protein, partial [Elusimicrobiota bacterium]
ASFVTKDANGNVGIGTSSPVKKLDVAGGVRGTELCIGADCRTAWPTVSGGGGAGGAVWQKVDEWHPSNETSHTFTSLDPNKPYRIAYYLKGSHLSLAVYMRVGGDSTASYYFARDIAGTDNGSSVVEGQGNAANEIILSNAGQYHIGQAEFRTVDTSRVVARSNGFTYQDGDSYVTFNNGGLYTGSSAATEVTFFSTPGSITGDVLLFELAEGGGGTGGGDGHSLDAADGSPTDAVIVDNDGKVGIGTMAPMEKLDVTGTVRATSFIGDGSSLTGISGGDTDWTESGDNVYKTSGNVGIGTASPAETLHLHRPDGPALQFSNNNNMSVRMGQFGANTADFEIWNSRTAQIRFGTDNAERMRIGYNGNVGIGTASPTQMLDVNGTVKATAFVGDGSGLSNVGGSLWSEGTGVIYRTSGNVGIGTTAPGDLLQIGNAVESNMGLTVRMANTAVVTLHGARNSSEPIGTIRVRNDGAGTTIGELSVQTIQDDKDSGRITFSAAKDGALNEYMRITEDGDVGIGTASPGAGLEIQGRPYTKVLRLVSNPTGYPYILEAIGQSGQTMVNGQGSLYTTGCTAIGASSPCSQAQLHIYNGTPGRVVLKVEGQPGQTADPLQVFSKQAQVFTVKADGKVGIGTTSPAWALDIKGGDTRLRLDGSQHAIMYLNKGSLDYGTQIEFQTAGVNQWYMGSGYAGIEDFVIGSRFNGQDIVLLPAFDGKVGIGTASPEAKLEVRQAGGGVALRVDNDGGNHGVEIKVDGDLTDNKSGLYIHSETPQVAGVAYLMRVEVNSQSSDQYSGAYYGYQAGAGKGMYLQTGPSSSNALYIHNGSSVSDAIRDNHGARLTAGGVWADASSRELKENFTPVDSARMLDTINSLPLAEYNYKVSGDGIKHFGAVAEDWHDAFGYGNDQSISGKDVGMVALQGIQELTSTIKELRKLIDAQQAEIATLKSLMK